MSTSTGNMSWFEVAVLEIGSFPTILNLIYAINNENFFWAGINLISPFDLIIPKHYAVFYWR